MARDPLVDRSENQNFVQLLQHGDLDKKPCMSVVFFKSSDPDGAKFKQIELAFHDEFGALYMDIDRQDLAHVDHIGTYKSIQQQAVFALSDPVSMATGLKAIFKRHQYGRDEQGDIVPTNPIVSVEMQKAILDEIPDILLSAQTLERDI